MLALGLLHMQVAEGAPAPPRILIAPNTVGVGEPFTLELTFNETKGQSMHRDYQCRVRISRKNLTTGGTENDSIALTIPYELFDVDSSTKIRLVSDNFTATLPGNVERKLNTVRDPIKFRGDSRPELASQSDRFPIDDLRIYKPGTYRFTAEGECNYFAGSRYLGEQSYGDLQKQDLSQASATLIVAPNFSAEDTALNLLGEPSSSYVKNIDGTIALTAPNAVIKIDEQKYLSLALSVRSEKAGSPDEAILGVFRPWLLTHGAKTVQLSSVTSSTPVKLGLGEFYFAVGSDASNPQNATWQVVSSTPGRNFLKAIKDRAKAIAEEAEQEREKVRMAQLEQERKQKLAVLTERENSKAIRESLSNSIDGVIAYGVARRSTASTLKTCIVNGDTAARAWKAEANSLYARLPSVSNWLTDLGVSTSTEPYTDANSAYAAFQMGKCGAFVSSATDAVLLVGALERDNQDLHFFKPSSYDAMAANLATKLGYSSAEAFKFSREFSPQLSTDEVRRLANFAVKSQKDLKQIFAEMDHENYSSLHTAPWAISYLADRQEGKARRLSANDIKRERERAEQAAADASRKRALEESKKQAEADNFCRSRAERAALECNASGVTRTQRTACMTLKASNDEICSVYYLIYN